MSDTMSDAMVYVKFPNEILFGCYIGSVDILNSELTTDSEWWHKVSNKVCTCGNDESVEIYQDYAYGGHWTGRACRSCQCITSETQYYDEDDGWTGNTINGIQSITKVTKGVPRWLPDYWREE